MWNYVIDSIAPMAWGARNLISTQAGAAGVLEAVDAGARAALLLDPVLPSNRHAQEEREHEEGQEKYEPDDPPEEVKRDARLPGVQRVFADASVLEDEGDDCKEQVHYE